MSVVSALYASAAILLVMAGAAKLSRPAADSTGLLGFRARAGMVRLIGALEAAAGATALLVGGAATWAVGVLYALFALVVLRAVLVGARSCGCFGRLDAPPSLIHVVGNSALAAVSFAAAGESSPTFVQAIGDSPAVGAALAAVVALVAGLLLVSFTSLPEALGARTSRLAGAGLFRALPPSAASRAASQGAGARQ